MLLIRESRSRLMFADEVSGIITLDLLITSDSLDTFRSKLAANSSSFLLPDLLPSFPFLSSGRTSVLALVHESPVSKTGG